MDECGARRPWWKRKDGGEEVEGKVSSEGYQILEAEERLEEVDSFSTKSLSSRRRPLDDRTNYLRSFLGPVLEIGGDRALIG